jgi:hypothetical protein
MLSSPGETVNNEMQKKEVNLPRFFLEETRSVVALARAHLAVNQSLQIRNANLPLFPYLKSGKFAGFAPRSRGLFRYSEKPPDFLQIIEGVS